MDKTIKFTLKGVDIPKAASSKETSKFITARTRKKHGVKIQNFVGQTGNRIKVAYTGNVRFEADENSDVNYCFWDSEEYDCPKICVPISYKVDNGIHSFKGIKSFCSLQCLYAFLRSEEQKDVSLRPTWLVTATQLMFIAAKYMYGKDFILKPALEKESLKKYDGYLTIEEFRRDSSDKTMVSTPNVRFNQIYETHLVE